MLNITMPTLELTLEQLINLIQQLPMKDKQTIFEMLKKDLNQPTNPWLQIAGKYKDDPQFEEMLTYIEADRKEQDNL
jgi:hypothetical protein